MRYLPTLKELVVKVVYCGPGMAGKTSNLQAIRRRIPADRLSPLVTLDDHSERSIRFDWLATELGEVQGNRIRIEVHTIPGQSYYAATRKQLLVGVDGIVFVADSRREALDENIDAMNELLNHLRQLGVEEDLPIVLQYNKQDLPTAVAPEQLAPLMNPRGWPTVAACAHDGLGVGETLDALLQRLAPRLAQVELPAVPEDTVVPSSWLLTCWRCQTMLDVPSADPGEVYTCGACHSPMEVVDGDRGLTREPVAGQRDSDLLPAIGGDPFDGGALATLPSGVAMDQEGPALAEGYTHVADLDLSPVGHRQRWREIASGRTFRALVLSPALLAHPGYRDTLDPYVRLAGPVRHQNLIPLVTMRAVGESVVLISADAPEFEPLSVVLARRRALAPPHAVGILRQVCLALEEGARHGAVHGWLRPEAILVNGDGVVLVDELALPVPPRFLVRELAGESAATEYYLPPEYLEESSRPDVRSDIFLLGALLFRMLTGEGQVTGYNAHEALHRIAANGARSLRDAQPGLSRELSAFHQRLVATDRRDRFQSYREVLDALERFGGGAQRQNLQLTRQLHRTPRHGTPVGPNRRSGAITNRTTKSGEHGSGSSPTRRKPASSAGPVLVVLLILAVVGGGVAAVVISQRPHPVPAAPAEPAVAATPRPAPMAPTPVTPAPVAAPVPAARPAPVAAPVAAPAPVTTPAAGPLNGQARSELLHRIADLKLNERFAEAVVAVDALEDEADRQAQREQISALHARRRADIEALVGQGAPTPRIAELLGPARTVWGMAGDEEWASQVMGRAMARGNAPPAAPTTGTPGTPTAPATPPVAGSPTPEGTPAPAPEPELTPVVPEPLVVADAQVVAALVAGNGTAAQAAAQAVPADNAAGKALRRLVALWQGRLPTVAKVVTAHAAKLRVPHPTSGDQWDVVGVDEAKALVVSPQGSSTELAWTQLTPRIQAKLWSDAATAAAGPLDHATAAAMNLLADDAALAGVHLKKGRAAMKADLVTDLEALIELNQHRLLVATLNRGVEAVKAGNAKAAADVLGDLKRFDKALLKPHEDITARLDKLVTAGKAPSPGKAADTAAAAGAKDLREKQAALRTLGWEPQGAAHLDGTVIVLPPNTAVATAIPPNCNGFTLTATGAAGFLKIIPTRPNGPQNGINLPIPADEGTFSLKLSREALVIIDRSGKVIDTLPLSIQATQLIIRSTADARLTSIPQPTFP